MNLDAKAVQREFGALVGVTHSAVQHYLSKGFIVRGGTYREWLLAYTKRLREEAAGRYSAGELDLTEERARLARAQSERIEMDNAVTRGELASIDTLRDTLADVAGQIAAILDAIPGKVKREAPHLTAQDVDILRREIAKARNLASEVQYDPDRKE